MGEFLTENAQLCVFWAEVVAPLADAMGFVDGKQRDLDVTEQIAYFRHQFLRRDIEEFHAARDTFTPDDCINGRIITAIEGFGFNAIRTKCLYLVFHQTDKRGNHNGCA